MYSSNKIIRTISLIGAFALSTTSQAVSPPPDGGYPGNNTAEGTNALFSLTTGIRNTADGSKALRSNATGSSNTADGAFALTSNTTGSANNATGVSALFSNTTGQQNSAIGDATMLFNTTGSFNTADGVTSLQNNTTGNFNTALGNFAGANLTTGDNNIDIGNLGVDGESNTIRIGGDVGGGYGSQTATFIAAISGTAVVGDTVVVDANGQLGTVASAVRFKKEIRPMDKTSEAILALKPVSFQYKSDGKGTPQFGLIAEEVAKVNPDLVVRDRKGDIYSVRYEAVNAMLLNEFLKEHRKMEEQEATIAKLKNDETNLKATGALQQNTNAEQQKEIQALTASLKEQAAQIQKVSDKVEASKSAPQVVAER